MTTSVITKTYRTTLSRGSQGDSVKYLQVLLDKFYYNSHIATDAIFGSQTETFVKQFQTDCFITVDGIVGEQTWGYLEEVVPFTMIDHSTLHQGDQGSEVKYLQVRLNEYYGKAKNSSAYGRKLEADGIFGSLTLAMVKQFQEDYGLEVNGVADTKTWNALEQSDYDV